MKPGPAPTPTAILRARGSWRAKTRTSEPRPRLGKPPCPRWLSKDAKTEWRRLATLLDDARVLAKSDGNSLSRYCIFLTRWRDAELYILEHGSTYRTKDKNGKPAGHRPFPQVAIAAQLARELARLEREFGLTPAARSGVTAEKREESTSNSGDKSRFFH